MKHRGTTCLIDEPPTVRPPVEFAHSLDNNHPERFGALPDFKYDAALDFVKLK